MTRSNCRWGLKDYPELGAIVHYGIIANSETNLRVGYSNANNASRAVEETYTV